MSAVQRVTGAFGARFSQGEPRKRLPRSVLASIAVVAGWLLVNLVSYASILIPAGEEDSLLAKRSSAPVAQRSNSIPSTPFFGVAAVKAESEPDVDLANIPVTQLNLVLSGVLDSSAKDQASALVAEKGKPSQRVYIGDTLPGGAELYSVAVDHIVLRRNGKMEKLTYPDEDGRPSVAVRRQSSYARRAVEAAVSNEASRGDKQQSIRERLEELRALARERRADRRQ